MYSAIPVLRRRSESTEKYSALRGCRCLFLAACVFVSSVACLAKDAASAAIVLFDGEHGPAYIQLTAVTLNGKAEGRVCDEVPTFDRTAYNGLARVSLVGASSLQRGTDGVLKLTVNGVAVCIVPSNLKFDRKPQLTPAEAADQAVLQGTPFPASTAASAIPTLKPGVQVFFVAAPDSDFADFLRAQRANTVKDWQDFLGQHPSSQRAADAQKSIAALHETAAEMAWGQYQRSGTAGNRDLAMLRQAGLEAQAATQAFPGYDPALKLTDKLDRELDQILQADRDGLQAFQKGLQDRNAHYSQLAAARAHVLQMLTVEPDYRPLGDLRREIGKEERKLETAVLTAESLKASSRFDDALSALGAYSCLATEIPRIDAIVSAGYRYHLERGRRQFAAQQWEDAVHEFRAAASIRTDNREATSGLNDATARLNALHDQDQATAAVVKSNNDSAHGLYVEAYETLVNLPDSQRALVEPQLSALKSNYVSDAMRRAQRAQSSHIPIRTRPDEDGVREACELLGRVSALVSDPGVTLRHDFLSSKLSAYYLDQASHYLDKPSGTGAAMGWLYLKQAERYAVTNLDSIKDQIAKLTPLYQRRAQLSVGIVFRDQTTRQGDRSFADQLSDALANGLDSSGTGVVVVRKPPDGGDALQPNFLLVAEVLQHRVVRTEAVEAPESKYRAGTHDAKNAAWLQAQADYDSAQQQLTAAQQALADAQSQHRRKEMLAAASEAVEAAQGHTNDAKRKLDTTDENVSEAVIETYHYTKKTVDLTANVEIMLRITDRSGNLVGQSANIRKNSHKNLTIVTDAKPEDTAGITNQNAEPDQAQFLSDLEIEARDAMVSAVRDSVSKLPPGFLLQARNDVQRGDLDEAAEQYILFLNATSQSDPGRDEAISFLHDRFNVAVEATSKL
jgi:hypothetical protein